MEEDDNRERIPKNQGRVWQAVGDGSCMFYSIQQNNAHEAGRALRSELANFAAQNWDEMLSGLECTVSELITQRGQTKEQYLRSVVNMNEYAGEVELVLLSRLCGLRLRVFMDKGESWDQCAQYGDAGAIKRLLFRPRTEHVEPHYDLIVPKEVWIREQQLKEHERERRKPLGQEQERAPVTIVDLQEARAKALEDESRRQQQTRHHTRQLKLRAIRSQPTLSQERSTQELLELMAASGDGSQPIELDKPNHPVRARSQPQRYQGGQGSLPEDTETRHKGATPLEQAPAEQDGEATTHNWKEGARIGEAENPGPQGASQFTTNQPAWNHAPEQRHQQFQAYDKWCGTWALPKAPAGEFTKGTYPGPKPSDDPAGNRPGGTAGGDQHQAAMINNNMSRAGTAQHTQPKRGRDCWYGQHCKWKHLYCPYNHQEGWGRDQGARQGEGQGRGVDGGRGGRGWEGEEERGRKKGRKGERERGRGGCWEGEEGRGQRGSREGERGWGQRETREGEGGRKKRNRRGERWRGGTQMGMQAGLPSEFMPPVGRTLAN
jgi:hypothetical protein